MNNEFIRTLTTAVAESTISGKSYLLLINPILPGDLTISHYFEISDLNNFHLRYWKSRNSKQPYSGDRGYATKGCDS